MLTTATQWSVISLLENESRPANRAAIKSFRGDLQSVPNDSTFNASLDPFTWGVLADAFNVGHRLWWLKRARDFENAKPLPGEYHGNATREELSARWRWCDAVARACRAKAETVGFDEELEHLLREAS